DGIVASNPEGVVLVANRASTALLSCRASDLVGRRFEELARPERDVTGQLTLSRRDGSRFPVEYHTSPIQVGEELVGYVDTFRDITQRLEVEQLKDQFVGVVSHELRTPLTSIKGSLALLASGAFGTFSAEQTELLDLARSNAERLALLVDDILNLDRLDAGRMPLNPEALDAAELADKTVRSLQGAARSADVLLELHRSTEDEPLVVWGDPMRLGQALSNLVGNAIKFSNAGGRVIVASGRADGPQGPEVTLAVTDEGPGIPQDQQEAVFNRFHQVDPRERGSRTGSGLGLSIAKGIVERSGGRLWLRSSVGRGSTFGISLPAANREK
ncbi:MAG: sensor histidine kinase, partial [Actinomycetes bacterium]